MLNVHIFIVHLLKYKLAKYCYHIARFVWKVLICANYARSHGLAHFNSTVTLNSAIVLGVSQLCTLLYIMWSKCRYLVSRRLSSLHWTAKDLGDCDDSTTLQSIFCNKTLPSYASLWRCDHRWLRNSTSGIFECRKAIFMWSCDLMNKWAHMYSNLRYYCRAEKLMFHRNWASQKKPTISYVLPVYLAFLLGQL